MRYTTREEMRRGRAADIAYWGLTPVQVARYYGRLAGYQVRRSQMRLDEAERRVARAGAELKWVAAVSIAATLITAMLTIVFTIL